MTVAEWLDAGKWALDWGLRAVPVLVLVQQYRNRKTHLAVAAGVVAVADDIAVVKADVAEVKRETNHMKDELVASTAKASHAEGMQDQRDKDST